MRRIKLPRRRRGPLWFCYWCSYSTRTRDQHPKCPRDSSELILSKLFYPVLFCGTRYILFAVREHSCFYPVLTIRFLVRERWCRRLPGRKLVEGQFRHEQRANGTPFLPAALHLVDLVTWLRPRVRPSGTLSGVVSRHIKAVRESGRGSCYYTAMTGDGWTGIINRELALIRCPEHGEQRLVLATKLDCGCRDCEECVKEIGMM